MTKKHINGHALVPRVTAGEPGLIAGGGSVLERSACLILVFIILVVLTITTRIAYPEVKNAKALIVRQGHNSRLYKVVLSLPGDVRRQLPVGAAVNFTLLEPAQLAHRSLKAVLPALIDNGSPFTITLPEDIVPESSNMALPDSIQAEAFIPVEQMSLLQRIFSRQARHFK